METKKIPDDPIINEAFLSYLWGMETRKKLKKDKRLDIFLSYLWGMETCPSRAQTSRSRRLFILPMRNGNHHGNLQIDMGFLAFYPTYEEWKPKSFSLMSKSHPAFYPTYEEWKLYTCPSFLSCSNNFLSYLWGMETRQRFSRFYECSFSFYPTYEEWKPIVFILLPFLF